MSATDPLQPVAVLHSGHPLAGPCQASKQPHGGVSRQLLIIHYFPSAVSDRVRFFSMWLRRIAPDTHQDQASGDALPVALAAFAAPEERWCRNESNGFITYPWLPIRRRQSISGSRCRRSVALQIGDGDTASNSFVLAVAPVRFPGLPCPVMT